MIAIWILSFWQNLGSPKNLNLVELGAGNGEMMKFLLRVLKNFQFLITHVKFISMKKVQN